MKRFILLLIFAVIISGGTVGILYQQGIGGKFDPSSHETALYEEDLLASAQAEEQDIAESYGTTEETASEDTSAESVTSDTDMRPKR